MRCERNIVIGAGYGEDAVDKGHLWYLRCVESFSDASLIAALVVR